MYVHMYEYICAYICVCMDDWNDTLGYMCAMYVPEQLEREQMNLYVRALRISPALA